MGISTTLPDLSLDSTNESTNDAIPAGELQEIDIEHQEIDRSSEEHDSENIGLFDSVSQPNAKSLSDHFKTTSTTLSLPLELRSEMTCDETIPEESEEENDQDDEDDTEPSSNTTLGIIVHAMTGLCIFAAFVTAMVYHGARFFGLGWILFCSVQVSIPSIFWLNYVIQCRFGSMIFLMHLFNLLAWESSVVYIVISVVARKVPAVFLSILGVVSASYYIAMSMGFLGRGAPDKSSVFQSNHFKMAFWLLNQLLVVAGILGGIAYLVWLWTPK